MRLGRRYARLTAVLAAALLFAGCDEKAREFAAKAILLLDERAAQLSRKIAAEKDAYGKAALHAADDHRALVDALLQNERSERADTLAADYDEGRKSVSLWRKDLAEYARIDYEVYRRLITDDLDISSRYLQLFAELTLEQDKVDALSKLLAALAKTPSLKDDVVALGAFANDTKAEFDKKVCADLKVRKAGASDDAQAAQKAYTAKKCDDVLK